MHKFEEIIISSLEKRLRALGPGQEVSIEEIARKQGMTEELVEQEILALLEKDVMLGFLNAFAGVFTRTPNPTSTTSDANLGESISALKQAYVDWEVVQKIDEATAMAAAAERVVQRANAILEAIERIGIMIAGKAYNSIDVSALTATDLTGLREAIELLSTKKISGKDGMEFPGTVKLWNRAGIIAQKLGWLAEAGQFYESALVLDPKNHIAWNNLGTVRTDQRNLKGAVEAFERALALDSKYLFAWVGLGNARYVMKDYTGSIQAYEQALTIDPKNDAVWNNIGNARSKLKDDAGAVQAYEKALSFNPKHTTALCNLGIARKNLGDPKSAVKVYKKALALDPKKIVAWIGLGNANTDMKELKQAIEAYQTALALDPKNAEAWHDLAVAYKRHNKVEEALYCYEQTAALGNPNGQKKARELHAQGITPREIRLPGPL